LQAILAPVAVFNIFNLKKIPETEFRTYGEQSLETLLQHYGVPKAAVTPNGDPFTKKPLISSDIQTEWKTFRHYCSRQEVKDTKAQLKELCSHEMLVTTFPNLNVLVNICLTILVSIASGECSFS